MDLHGDEKILYAGNPSWRSQIKGHLLTIVVAILVGAIVVLAADTGIGIGIAIVVLLVGMALLWIERSRTRYVISSHRLHVREGFLAKEVQETRLDRITNVTTSQSVPERLLRIGTVDYDTAGDDGSRFQMTGVPHPDRLVRIVDEAQRAAIRSDREQAARVEARADAEIRRGYDDRGYDDRRDDPRYDDRRRDDRGYDDRPRDDRRYDDRRQDERGGDARYDDRR
ncbi:MAG: PH domain-containing protein [Solirubrobacteraceae bacterium]|nr:PH domain-containing protein [Solirubrobacteraceae bacterium]